MKDRNCLSTTTTIDRTHILEHMFSKTLLCTTRILRSKDRKIPFQLQKVGMFHVRASNYKIGAPYY